MRKIVTVVLSMVLCVLLLPVCALADVQREPGSSWLKLPYIYAPGYSEAPAVSVFGNGVTGGELVLGEATDAVPYADGATADLLTDGYHATFSESKHMAVCGIGENGDSRVRLNAKASASNNTGKMLKFTEADSGFEMQFAAAEEIASLHIWAWPSNAIDEYEVLVENGGIWETVQMGSLTDERNATVQTDCSTFYQLRFDQSYTTSAVRFVIKSFGENASYGVHLVEAVPRPTNEINLISVNPMRSLNQALNATTDTSYPIYFDTYVVAGYGWNENNVETGKNGLTVNCRRAGIWNNSNLFGKNKFGNTSGEYYPVDYPAYDTRVINPANRTVTPKNGYYAVASLGGTQQVNRISFLTSAINALQGMELFCTDDTAAWDSLSTKGIYRDAELDSRWNKLISVTGSFAANTVYTYDIANAPTAKYWAVRYLCNSHTVIQNTAMYSLREDELSAYAATVSSALEQVFEGAVATDSLQLPSEITDENGNPVSLQWSCDSALVDLSTGVITPPQNDTVIHLTATTLVDGQNYSLTKAVSVLGQDTRQKAVLKEEAFETQDAFSSVNGAVSVRNGTAFLENQAEASLSLQPDYGFSFSGKTTLELELNSLTSGGMIEFYDGSTKLLALGLQDGNIVAEYKDAAYTHAFTEHIKLEFSDGSFNLYFDEGSGATIRVYAGKLLTSGMVNCMKLVSESGQTLAIDHAKLTVASEELFRQVEEQFDLSKINPSGGSNLTENLVLFSQLADIAFTYTSSEPTSVNPVTGAVDCTVSKQVMLGVNAVSPTGSFSKSFTAAVTGLANVAASSVATANTVALTGYETTYVNDDNLDTEFRSPEATGWKLTLDFKEKKPLNQLCFYEIESAGKINGFTVSLSEDGNTYTEVYTGTEITSGALIPIPTQFARYLRINVTSVTQPITGFKEVYAFLKQNDREKLEYDMNEITTGLEIKKDVRIPKAGTFGSGVTVTTDNSLITAVSDGEFWKINTLSPTVETVVKVTLTFQNGGETQQKEYNVILLADTDIRENQPVIGGGIVGGGGFVSGGGGGGGGISSVYMPSVETRVQDSAYAPFEQELSGHWGKQEIMTLVKQNVVSGDGKSLQLKNTVTRAEFLKMLLEVCKLEKLPYDGGFQDITSDLWYADYAQTAKHYGIMSGDGTNFRGSEPITRQEMAVTLVNCIRLLDAQLPSEGKADFTDSGEIAVWAADSVAIAVELSLLNGYETGAFLPKNHLLRDEAMVVAYRVLTNFAQ